VNANGKITEPRQIASLGLLLCFIAGMSARGGTTIDPEHPFAHGANIGWLNSWANGNDGAVMGQYFCTGFLWSADCGWICLGSGTPVNGYQFANDAPGDYGINHDGQGSLRGFAWGANIGWIHFESNGDPRVDLRTGNLSGFAWGANVGWINLSNAQAHVRTAFLDAGLDADTDGLPDAWECEKAQSTRVLSGGSNDQDDDGVTDEQEYAADTDPLDDIDFLQMVSIGVSGSTHRVAWTARPTRLYALQATNDLRGTLPWTNTELKLLGPIAFSPTTQTLSDVTATMRFYRVQALVPLSP